jgi:broad specificity phosphatase PhoE
MKRSIYIIRHGEKKPVRSRVDAQGKWNGHSLVPRGWERAHGLVKLFDGPSSALTKPTQLIAPSYKEGRAPGERTHETIQPLADALGLTIGSPFGKKDAAKLGEQVVVADYDVTLICWDHKYLPKIPQHVPIANGVQIPATWPPDRFDVVWCFERDEDSSDYSFRQVPQMLLVGDQDSPIPS